jgi:ubiquinone biosynthesis protein UbiJ
MNALQSMLQPVARLINRQLRQQTPARELSASLDGRTLALRVSDTAITIYLNVQEGEIRLLTEYETDPDVVIAGSMLSLARLSGPDAEELMRDGTVAITGDAMLAQQFRKLLRYGRPDFEEELSTLVGDVAAHGIGQFFREAGEWAAYASKTMQQNVSEYLQEERRAVPSSIEAERFRRDVNTLRDDVERFEARLRKSERGQDAEESSGHST